MKASEWIDRVKAAKGLPSDYAAAKALSVSRQVVSDYRKRDVTMDEETAIKVAEALGERPEAVYLDQLAERTKSPALRSALTGAARQLCILCKVDRVPEVIAGMQRVLSASLVSC